MNDLTPHLRLPLPHPANDLESDVQRLRDALQGVDSHLALIDQLLSSDDMSLDSVQELVDAIKAARGDMTALDQLIAERLDAYTVMVTEQLNQQNAAVSAQLSTLSALVYAGL